MLNLKIFSIKVGLDWEVRVITFTKHFWISGFETWPKWLLGPLALGFWSVIGSDSGKSLSPTSLGFYKVPRSCAHISSQEFISFVCLGAQISLCPSACNQSLIWVETWSHGSWNNFGLLAVSTSKRLAELGVGRHTFKSWLWNLLYNSLSLYEPQFHHLQNTIMALFQSLCREL